FTPRIPQVAVHDQRRATGASGQAGRAVVAGLRAPGYRGTAGDVAVTRADRGDGMLQADLTDYGQAVEALSEPGADAVVHLANIPAPGIPFIALRFSNIMAPEDYQEFPSVWDDPHKRKWNLWGYIDQRDVA